MGRVFSSSANFQNASLSQPGIGYDVRRFHAGFDQNLLCKSAFRALRYNSGYCLKVDPKERSMHNPSHPVRTPAAFLPFLAAALLGMGISFGAAVDAPTLKNKVLFGYQGWFDCP